MIFKIRNDAINRVGQKKSYYERSAVRQLMRLEEYLISRSPAGLRAWVARMRILTEEADGIIPPDDRFVNRQGIISLTKWTSYNQSLYKIYRLRHRVKGCSNNGSLNNSRLSKSKVYELLYAMQQAADYFLYPNKPNEMDYPFFDEMRRKGLVKLRSVFGPDQTVQRPTNPGGRHHIQAFRES